MITSAGIVLAATFSALAVLPILFLVQIAFMVAFGVLLDTMVVRSLLVPALSYDIGPSVWWPSKLARAATHPLTPHLRSSGLSWRGVSSFIGPMLPTVPGPEPRELPPSR